MSSNTRCAWAGVMVSALLLTACEGVIQGGLPGGGGVGGDTTGSSGSSGGSSGSVPADLPCDVAQLLAAQCTSCHGATLSGGAPFPLASRADLLREVRPGETAAMRSVARMKQATAPMPPAPFPAPAAADIAVLDAWVQGGTPPGACSGASDAGPPPLTCLSSSTWTRGNRANENMNPGLACQACHVGRNVLGQNPGLVSEPERAYQFMGTVFRGLNEKNLCNAQLPGEVSIEIVGADGNTITRMLARAGSGNFFSDGEAPMSDRLLLVGDALSLPYTARVTANGRTIEMKTPQMSGDCNECHTERGDQRAPGRIVAP